MKNKQQLSIQPVADAEHWRERLSALAADQVYNNWGWGEYKRAKGWALRRVEIMNPVDQTIVLTAQIQTRKVLFASIHLIQGGIATGVEREEDVAGGLSQLLEHLNPGPLDLLIIDPGCSASPHVQRALMASRFAPLVNSQMYSVELDLSLATDDLRMQLTSNWRHNLKRAESRFGLTVSFPESQSERANAMEQLQSSYRKLIQRKAFVEAVDTTLIAETVIADSRFIMLEVHRDGELLASRVGYAGSTRMLDFLAASSEGAKKTYANYLALWALIERAQQMSLSSFDCGGIDPAGNPGVYRFKKGLSGQLVLNGPRWLYSRSRVSSALFRLLSN